jgi:hypothetical protein
MQRNLLESVAILREKSSRRLLMAIMVSKKWACAHLVGGKQGIFNLLFFGA